MLYPLVLSPFDQTDIDALMKSVQSGQFTMGPMVKQFEQAFAKKMNSRFAVMVNSGSSANLIASFAFLYKKNNLSREDEVLVPAIGWSTTWSPLHHAGFKLKVVDVNPDTLNVDVEAYERAITPKTKMIVTVSVLGNPVDLKNLRTLCDQRGLILFEDNCESIGAKVDNRYCGTFGHVGTFSFFYSHHISTIEGGMVVTDDEELYTILLSLRAHGWIRDLPENNSVTKVEQEHKSEKYSFIFPGFNVRPLDLAGAIGLNQLTRLDGIVEKRIRNAESFHKMMKAHENKFSIQKQIHGTSSWFSFPVILKNGSISSRDKLFSHLKKYEIESRIITGGCLTLHPMKKFFSFSEGPAPVIAERIHNTGLFVANHAVDMT
ncbi:MAG: DegT/DnrJ/EryC1/StrS family aminotransferase, partial [Pseudobdellovibrio sp.]